jgi:hypothetical protein
MEEGNHLIHRVSCGFAGRIYQVAGEYRLRDRSDKTSMYQPEEEEGFREAPARSRCFRLLPIKP